MTCARARRRSLVSRGKLGALLARVTMEREVSLPFAPPTPASTNRAVDPAESSALRLQVAALLDRRADDIAACWENAADAAALVRILAASLASGGDSIDDAVNQGSALGSSAFEARVALPRVLRALDRLEGTCLEVVANAMAQDGAPSARLVDGIWFCRQLRQVAAAVAAAAAEGYAGAADRALQERFRRLRHDLRNPLGTIQSALSLLADETVPEEARRSPRFRAMIERNTAALDQMIVSRLSDGEARVVPAPPPGDEPSSTSFVVGEPRDDLARPRERDDRQPSGL
jgi:signal transduction histidine kinase